MNSIDEIDNLIKITNLPLASAGAPIPIVLADENTAILEYYMQEDIVIDDEIIDQVAIIIFTRCLSVSFGPPNDEAISGHPLYAKGLRPYTFYRVNNSSWIDKFKQMNKVHPYHKDSLYNDYTHYIFCFHDSIFECISQGISYEISKGSLLDNIDLMKEKL